MGTQFFLVVDYCSGGDLKEFLDKQPGKRLDEDGARGFMCQLGKCLDRYAVWLVASGLKALHEMGIVHRDLKPHNSA